MAGIMLKIRRYSPTVSKTIVILCIAFLLIMFLMLPAENNFAQKKSSSHIRRHNKTQTSPLASLKFNKMANQLVQVLPDRITKIVDASSDNNVINATIPKKNDKRKNPLTRYQLNSTKSSNISATQETKSKFAFKMCKELNTFLLTQSEVGKLCKTEIKDFCIVDDISTFKTDKFVHSKLTSAVNENTLKIYTYSEAETISKSLITVNKWEHGMVVNLMKNLQRHTNAIFVDIGSNLGVYSLNAATLKRKVIAIDANYHNVLRLKKSAVENKLDIAVLWNAVSTKTVPLRMAIQKDCNIGGSAPIASTEETNTAQYEPDDVRVFPASLDKLMTIYDHKEAILKIDVEGQELDALKSGSKYFDNVRVHCVMMEWAGTPLVREQLIEFFTGKNFHPYTWDGADQLSGNPNRWPHDIMWINKS